MGRWLIIGLTVLVTGAVQADEPRYLIEMELWLHGEQAGTPTMIVEAGEPANIEVGGDDHAWRIEVEVERPAASEAAPEGAIWLHVAVQEKSEGEWDHLADSILGVPEGELATLSVVEGEVAEPGPANSLVYLTARTSRLRPE